VVYYPWNDIIILVHFMHHFLNITMDGISDFVAGIWIEITLETGICMVPPFTALFSSKPRLPNTQDYQSQDYPTISHDAQQTC
jgi:hypothetical protein